MEFAFVGLSLIAMFYSILSFGFGCSIRSGRDVYGCLCRPLSSIAVLGNLASYYTLFIHNVSLSSLFNDEPPRMGLYEAVMTHGSDGWQVWFWAVVAICGLFALLTAILPFVNINEEPT